MAEKRHSTIIIVPHASGRVFKVELSRMLVRSLAFLGVAVAILSVVSVVASGKFLRQRAFFRTLQDENERLKSNNLHLSQAMAEVQAGLTQFEQRTKALAITAGVASLFSDADSGGVGTVGSGGPLIEMGAEPKELVQREEQLDQHLAKIEKRLSEQALVLSHTPVLAPVVGVITDGFGPRIDPLTHQPAFHDGLDISAAVGTVISAPADGIVVYAGRDSSYGRVLRIDHGYGYTTLYAHLDRFLVKEGVRVTRGQPIGKVGISGRSTGPHLHYEVWKDGEKQNPLYYILDAY